MESVPENVIKQHGTGQSDIDRASKRAEEEAARRYEAAAWLRRTVGVVGAKDLPEEPSEEEFRIGLRNGIILCNALNKVQPGAIPKVVAAPADLCVIPDGAPLSAYQYFENVRNFLVTLQGMGLPTFQASDLERGGKDSSVVDSVLALKFYIESKDGGKNSSSKFGGITRHASSVKHFIRKSSDPFMNSISRAQSLPEKPPDDLSLGNSLSGDFLIHSTEVKSFNSLNTLVRKALSNKKTEEIPLIVETMLSKVMQEYERRIAYQKEMAKSTSQDMVDDNKSNSSTEHFFIDAEKKMEVHEIFCKIFEKESKVKGNAEIELEGVKEKENIARISKQQANEIKDKTLKERFVKQQLIFDRQQKEIQKLKCSLQFTKTGVEHMKSHYLEEFDNLRNRICLLATAASGYQKVLEENRKLYNQVQDLKGNIRVYCRVRPFLPGQMSSISILDGMDDQNITISSPLKTGKDARRSFTFNKVYGPSVSQEEVFSDTQPLIRSVLDGYNICIFAYGQTGSGKTHTMSGPKELNERTIGVNYRALNDLFYLSDLRKDTFRYDISVQMIEIYNEQVRDLLNDGLHRRLEIRNSSNKGVSVPDANLIPVRSTEEVIDVMNLGQKNRAVSCTAMNDRSSRSHSCLTIHVHGKELTSGNAIRGCMHLVDLAGSERVDKSEVKGERLKEAQHINKSLSALGDVIAALAQKNSHVPYRNSKLTQLLQDSLGGRAKTLMFVHISPEANALGETLSTLKFAERVATVELGHAKINKDSGEVKELKEQIAALKIELSKKEGGELLRPTTSSSDSSRIKQNPFSTTYANDEEDELRYRTNNRQPMEEVGDIEVRNNSTKQNNSNYHAEESPVSMESPWPDSSPQPDKDDREISSGESVDKVVVNNKSITRVGEDEVQEQELLLRYLNEMRVFTEHEVNGNAAAKERMNNFDSDSYDFENSASDSSDIESLNHLNVLSIPSKSKLKKPQAMGIKGMDGRNSIHGHVPTPSRKVLNGSTQTSNRTPRKPVSADGKRSGIQSGGN